MNDTRHLDIPYLTALREELLRGAARSNRRRRRMLLASRIALLSVAVAGAATAGFSLLGGGASGTQNADAAVLRHVRLAVTPPAGVVLHEKTINTLGGLQWGYEFWQRSDPPYSYRVIKGPTEAAFTGSTIETYDPATNTISAQPHPPPKLFDDPVAKLRELLAKGDAQIVATTTIDGQDVLKIVAHSSNDMLFNGTIYVDTKSYRPVLAEIQQNAYDCGHSSPCSGLERIRFLAYEYLPATTDTLSLVSVEAQHPSASVAAAPPPTDTSTGQTATTPQAGSKPTG